MKKLLIGLCSVFLLLYAQAYALTIDPSMASRIGYDARDSASFSSFVLHGPWYICDVETGERAAYLINDYETVFSPLPSPSEATITYTGDSQPHPKPTFIAVTGTDVGKDPAWYLLTLFSWNGTDDLFLSGFWPEQGSIASIAFYTPEPSTMLLVGVGLIGLAGYCRRRQSA